MMNLDVSIKLKALRVYQPLGEFYVVSIKAGVLRDLVFLDPTKIDSVDRDRFIYRLIGNQRESSKRRARSISQYINSTESAFPNSIILSANYTQNEGLVEDPERRWRVEEDKCGYSLIIPSRDIVTSVIDGQHRLLGFDYANDNRKEMELVCSVYLDLPVSYQAYLFATININQKKIDRSLAYEQFGYNLDDEASESWSPDKLAVYFTRKLNLAPKSPLYQHIKIIPLDAELVFEAQDLSKWQVSTACIVDGLLGLFSTNPKRDRDSLQAFPKNKRNRRSLPQDNSPLRRFYLDCEDEKIFGLVTGYFSLVRDLLWQTAGGRSYICKTVGIQALFDVFRYYANRFGEEGLLNELSAILEKCINLDFSDSFFQASGKGRTRIKNAILCANDDLDFNGLSDEDKEDYNRLVNS